MMALPPLPPSLQGVAEQAAFLFHAGGWVMMTPLVLCTVLLWFGLGYRFSALRMGNRQPVAALVEQMKVAGWSAYQPRGVVDEAVRRGHELAQQYPATALRQLMDGVIAGYAVELRRFRSLVKSTVIVAPLLGLLGTVVGMIETFKSLEDMALYTQDGGIAAGVSQALVTTQLGLAIAIPGMVIARFMDRKQQLIETELQQAKNYLCAEGGKSPAAARTPGQEDHQ